MTDFRLLAAPHNALRPSAAGIYSMRAPQLPQHGFEYHPETKKVYVIRGGHGTPIAENVVNAEQARYVVLYWARGYCEARAEFAIIKTG